MIFPPHVSIIFWFRMSNNVRKCKFYLGTADRTNSPLIPIFLVFSFVWTRTTFSKFTSTIGGGLLCKPMNLPLNGVVEIAWANIWNLWIQISPAIMLVGPWNLLLRAYCSQNYITAISDKITYWEGEQFHSNRPFSHQLKETFIFWFCKSNFKWLLAKLLNSKA